MNHDTGKGLEGATVACDGGCLEAEQTTDGSGIATFTVDGDEAPVFTATLSGYNPQSKLFKPED